MRGATGRAIDGHVPSSAPAQQPAERPGLLSSLAAHCLRFLAEHPDASGTAVRDGLGMRHLSQTSRLLSRLERAGLVDNHHEHGRENAWALTDRGEALLNDLQQRWGVYA